MNHEQQPMNRAERRRAKPRRRQAITGLAFLAAASVATAYGQLLRSPGAYATATCTVTSNADAGASTLRECLDNGGGTITFSGVSSINLATQLPDVTTTTTISGGSGVTINGGAFEFLHVGSSFQSSDVLTIDGLTVTGFTDSGPSMDGVIYNGDEGTVVITNSTITNNGDKIAPNGEQPVWVKGALTVENSTFSGNYTTDSGGAIYKTGSGNLTITNSRFFDNEADDNGGALYTYEAGAVSIANSSFVSNSSDDQGGAIFVYGYVTGGTSITNSYIGGNTALKGAAVYTKADLTIDFSTITGNTSTGTPGDVNFGDPGRIFTVKGSLIDSTGTACVPNGATVTHQFAVTTDASCGFTGSGSVQSATSAQLDLATSSTQVVSGVTQTFRMPTASSILATGAPSNALGTGISADQIGTSRSATFTIGSVQVAGSTPPAPPAPPGPAPAPAPSATATPAPSVNGLASTQMSLDPVTGTQNPNVPEAGLPAGGSVLLVDGQPLPVTVRPDAPRNPSGLDVQGNGWNMQLVGRGGEGDPLGLSDSQALILQSRQSPQNRSTDIARKAVPPVAQASGKGFKPSSPVRFYLLPGTSLGELKTDASGTFAGAIPMPAGILPGTYTLQSNAFAPDGSVRSLSLGVIVKPAVVAPLRKASASVPFAALSSQLDASAKAQLRALAAKVKSGAVRSMVVGYVQPTASASNDVILSTARSRAVAAYLRSQGVAGVFVVSGEGKATEAGAAGRRVEVVVTYR